MNNVRIDIIFIYLELSEFYSVLAQMMQRAFGTLGLDLGVHAAHASQITGLKSRKFRGVQQVSSISRGKYLTAIARILTSRGNFMRSRTFVWSAS